MNYLKKTNKEEKLRKETMNEEEGKMNGITETKDIPRTMSIERTMK